MFYLHSIAQRDRCLPNGVKSTFFLRLPTDVVSRERDRAIRAPSAKVSRYGLLSRHRSDYNFEIRSNWIRVYTNSFLLFVSTVHCPLVDPTYYETHPVYSLSLSASLNLTFVSHRPWIYLVRQHYRTRGKKNSVLPRFVEITIFTKKRSD